MNDFRVEVKIKNAHLYKHIMSQFKNVAEFSREIGMSQKSIGDYLNLKRSPIAQRDCDGLLTPSAQKICDFFQVLPEEIFPDSINKLKLEKNTSYFELESSQMAQLLHNQDPMNELIDNCASELINESLNFLSKREQLIINMRFGLNGEKESTLGEVAKIFGVSADRIRQIEQRALRRLRSPVNSRKMVHLLYDDSTNESFMKDEVYNECLKNE